MHDTAGALAIYKGKILLILRDNIPTVENPNIWSIPGGIAEKGELPEETMLREFEEEACISPKTYKYVGTLFREIGGKTRVGCIYIVTLSDEEASKVKLGSEGQKIEFFTYKELKGIKLPPVLYKFFHTYGKTTELIMKGKTDILPQDLGLLP